MMTKAYAAKRGAPPPAEIAPSPEQLSALASLIKGNAPPYADFSIFGPYPRQAFKRLKHQMQIWDPKEMTYRVREMPGPASLEEWRRSWAVYRTAMLMLGVITD